MPRVGRSPEVHPGGQAQIGAGQGSEIVLSQIRGESKALVATPLYESPEDWSPDGKYLVYGVDSPETGGDLWYLKPGEGGDGFEAVPYLQTRFQERQAKFSPDGRFLAYCSDESGEYEVYVRTFPDGGGKQKVSRNGGTQPRWSRDGTELFYVEVPT